MAPISKTFQFEDLDQAQDYYYAQGLTDGLPIVLPTESSVRAMLDYVGMDGSEIVAEERFRGKKFVAEKVADDFTFVFVKHYLDAFHCFVTEFRGHGKNFLTSLRRPGDSP